MIKRLTIIVVSMFSLTAFAQYDKDMGIDPDFLYESITVQYATPPPPAAATTVPTTSTGEAFSALEIGAEAIALTEAGTTAAIAGGAGSAALASTFAVGAIAAPVIGSHATAGLFFVALNDNDNNGTTSTNSNSASAAQ